MSPRTTCACFAPACTVICVLCFCLQSESHPVLSTTCNKAFCARLLSQALSLLTCCHACGSLQLCKQTSSAGHTMPHQQQFCTVLHRHSLPARSRLWPCNTLKTRCWRDKQACCAETSLSCCLAMSACVSAASATAFKGKLVLTMSIS